MHSICRRLRIISFRFFFFYYFSLFCLTGYSQVDYLWAAWALARIPLKRRVFLCAQLTLSTYYVYAVCVAVLGNESITHTLAHTRTLAHPSIDHFERLWRICGSVKPIRHVIKVRTMRRMRDMRKNACTINEMQCLSLCLSLART